MSKLLFGMFDRLGLVFGWLQDLLRSGRSLAKVAGLVAALILGASLSGTWTLEEPDPAAEQSEGLVIVLPRGTDTVRVGDRELARREADNETLRMRLAPDLGLAFVTQYSVSFQEHGGEAIPFHVRERGDVGGRIAPLDNADPNSTYEIELLDTWEGGAWIEVTRTSQASEHPIALVGLGFAALAALLLLANKPRLALLVATGGLAFGVWSWKVYVPGLADQAGPQPTEVVLGAVQAPGDAEAASPDESVDEVAVEDLGLDWLTELEEELEESGEIGKQPDAKEPEAEDLGLDWLDDLEDELKAEGKLEGDPVAQGELAKAAWSPASAVVVPQGAFWS